MHQAADILAILQSRKPGVLALFKFASRDQRAFQIKMMTGEFADVTVENAGVVRAFTIIGFAPPGITIPYVAAVVDCYGVGQRMPDLKPLRGIPVKHRERVEKVRTV